MSELKLRPPKLLYPASQPKRDPSNRANGALRRDDTPRAKTRAVKQWMPRHLLRRVNTVFRSHRPVSVATQALKVRPAKLLYEMSSSHSPLATL